MGVVHSPDSKYAEEMRRWEALHTQYGPPGRPYEYREYPTQMYKAGRNDAGRSVILESRRAEDSTERERLERDGFVCGGQQAALDALERSELELAKLAAEINYDAQHKLSDKARAEVEAAQADAGMRHIGEIPEKPKRKHTRKAVQTA